MIIWYRCDQYTTYSAGDKIIIVEPKLSVGKINNNTIVIAIPVPNNIISTERNILKISAPLLVLAGIK